MKNIKFLILSLFFISLFFDTLDAKIKRKGGTKSKNSSKELSVQELEKEGWITNKNVYPSGSPDAIKGGMITMLGGEEYPSTFRDIGKDSRSQINGLLAGLQYEALLSFDYERLEWAPNLATHWKISADSLTYWFRLNPKAKFADGKDVTSEDVIATWDLLMDETILAPSSQITFGKFERPIAVSTYIVSVKAKSLDWMNLISFSNYMVLHPAHYLNDLDGTAFIEEYLFKMIPGTGPYVIHEKDIINQESYTLTRREDFWARENPFYHVIQQQSQIFHHPMNFQTGKNFQYSWF